RTRLTCSTGRSPHPLRPRAVKSVRRESHPPVHRGGVVPRLLRHGHVSKDGGIRTHSACFGGRLLSQEHVPDNQSPTAPAGLEPAPLPLTAGRTTVVLQGIDCAARGYAVPGVGVEPTPTGSEPAAL